ncbi:methyltransferase domain-containing protein [Nakamurella sp. YIM 132087]|uniref:Methyltransferase domain-containing protein n=2 Tax=Nakamurella alba TaxID=2665158 RepID=A0A7K1FL89_9ACTN|nr:methyltransferase domain-containing protein [Nakamurella alba]
MAARAALDIGCGSGALLDRARRDGHTGRLIGADPDAAAVAVASARQPAVEWRRSTAADLDLVGAVDLVTMAGNAFQCLVTDDVLSSSLVAWQRALRPAGRLVFDSRNPEARAWLGWTPEHATDVVDDAGRALRIEHRVQAVTPVGDGVLVDFTESTCDTDGTVLRTDRTTLRFRTDGEIRDMLQQHGFRVLEQYGGWDLGPVSPDRPSIIVVAQRV